MSVTYEKLKDIGKVITGKTPSTSDVENFAEDYPFITPSDIHTFDERCIYKTERGISAKGSLSLKGYKLPPNSICVVCIGSTIGKMCYTNQDCYTNQQINTLIPKDIYNSDYLFYLMRYFKGYFQLIGGGTGSGKGIVNKTAFEKIKIPVNNDILKQNKIAKILSAYDDLIENNNKRIELLENMAQELYKEWFVRFRFPGYKQAEFENGIPKDWKVIKLTSVANITYGYAFNSALFCEDSNLIPVVRIRDILDGKTKTYTTEKPDDKYLIKENEMLIGMDGIFHMNLWTQSNDYLNQRVVKLTSKHKKLSNYFIYFAVYPQIKVLESIIQGTTVAHLSAKDLNKMSILIPSDKLFELCYNKFESMLNYRKSLIKQNENLKTQRNLLLPRLMSGKLEV